MLRIVFSLAAVFLTPFLGVLSPAYAESTIRLINSGALEIDPYNHQVLETVAPAVLEIWSDEPVNLQVLSASLASGPSPDPSGTHHKIQVNAGGRQGDAGDRLALPPGFTQVEINMQVIRPENFVVGNSNYMFTVLTD